MRDARDRRWFLRVTGGAIGAGALFRVFPVSAEGAGPAPAFLTLLLAGAILALAYQRTGSLFMSMGLHAGWIFWLAAYRTLTRGTADGSPLIWGGDKLIDGWLPCLILAVVLAGVWRGCGAGAGPNFRKK